MLFSEPLKFSQKLQPKKISEKTKELDGIFGYILCSEMKSSKIINYLRKCIEVAKVLSIIKSFVTTLLFFGGNFITNKYKI
jgi:hypothetical protein